MKNRYSLQNYIFAIVLVIIGMLIGTAFKLSNEKDGKNPSAESKELSYFKEHFVGEGKFARIPLEFCKSYSETYTDDCGINFDNVEVDLTKHQLPVDKITAAVTDVNSRIVYTTAAENDGTPCPNEDLWIYKWGEAPRMLQRDTLQLSRCGAASNNLFTLSPGGNFIQFKRVGQTEGGGSYLYNIERQKVDPEVRSDFVKFISYEEGPLDEYVLYYSGCDFDLGIECTQKLTLKNLISGKNFVLPVSNPAVKKAGELFYAVKDMQYDTITDELLVTTNLLGGDFSVKGFKKYLNAVE